MTPDELVVAGEALFGKRWKAAMGRALNLAPNTIWRYATGQTPITHLVDMAVTNLLHRAGISRASLLRDPPE